VDTDELSVYVPMPRKSAVISSLHPDNWDDDDNPE